MRTKGFSIPTVLLGLVLLLLSEAARIFHVTGLPGLLVFFLPGIPLYLLLSKALDDGWERFLISSSLYIALMGLLLFIWRLNLFLPINFRALFLLVDFFIIAFSALLSFESAKTTVQLPRSSEARRELPVFALLVFTLLFYSSAAARMDSIEKELRQSKWATDVSSGYEGGQSGDILYFMQHPPLHALLGSITYNMFGFSQFSKALIYVVLAGLSVLGLVLLSKAMFKDRNPGIIAALFLVSSGLFMHFTATGDYEAPRIYFQVLFFYSLYRYKKTGSGLFYYSLPVLFSISVYAKHTNLIYFVPALAALLFKDIRWSRKDLAPRNIALVPAAGFFVLTTLFLLPLAYYFVESDEALNGKFGAIYHTKGYAGKEPLKRILDINRFNFLFPGPFWSVDNITGSLYENPPFYFLFAGAFLYFSYINFRKYPLFVSYVLYSFVVVSVFFPAVDWNHIMVSYALGLLAIGHFFMAYLKKAFNTTPRNAAVCALFFFVLLSSFIYTVMTVFDFDYRSGINFYRDSFFAGEPFFGVFAISKYLREHTSAANTYLSDTCFLPEAATNRNAWVGAAPPSYTIIPTSTFLAARKMQIEINQARYAHALEDRNLTAVFTYKGLPYAEVVRLFSGADYLDAGVCIEATEYGKHYKNWGLFFSAPGAVC